VSERRKRGWTPSGPETGAPVSTAKSITRLPPRGPWCAKCQHEFIDDELLRTQAYLAYQSQLVVTCPKCAVKMIPAMAFDVGTKAPEGATTRSSTVTSIKEDARKIIRSIFEIDLWPSWERINKQLSSGEKRNDYATVQKHLDEGEEMARLAHQVFVNFKIEFRQFEIDSEIAHAPMRDEANAILQAEKKGGERNKAITDADVNAKMAELHPDAFRRYTIEKAKFELAVAHAEKMTKIWNDRTRDLNTNFGKMRGGGER
jgi:hypothetical protein